MSLQLGNNPALSQFQLTARSLKQQRTVERGAIAAFLSIGIMGVAVPVLGHTRIPVWSRTLLLLAGLTGSSVCAIASRLLEPKERIYNKLREVENEAIGDVFQFGVGRMKTLTSAQQAIATYADIKQNIPLEQQQFALKMAGLESLEAAASPMPFNLPFIDVPATDPSRVGAIAVAPGEPVMSFVPNAQDLQDALNPAPPYRDLSVEIADYDGHIAYVSKTRSGKTSSMIRSIQRSQSTGKHVIVFDCKGDDRLRNMPGIEYVHFNHPSKCLEAFEAIKNILAELKHRQDRTRPNSVGIDVYVDEYNLGMDAADDFGKMKDPETGKEESAKTRWAKSWKRVVLQGAAENIRFRGAGHTSRVEDWGWNTGVLDSLSFVAFGRLKAYESIEDLIKHQISDTRKEVYKTDLERYRRQHDFGQAPLILTTLSPEGFYVQPSVDESIAYESTPPSFAFKVSPPANSVQKGTQSTNHDPKIKPRDLDAPNPARQLFEDFRAWYFTNSPVTDADLKAKWLEVRGEELTEQAISHLRNLLENKS